MSVHRFLERWDRDLCGECGEPRDKHPGYAKAVMRETVAMVRERDALRAQRDELLSACREALDWFEDPAEMDDHKREAIKSLRAAIAAARSP